MAGLVPAWESIQLPPSFPDLKRQTSRLIKLYAFIISKSIRLVRDYDS